MKNVDFNKIEKETVAKFKEVLTNDDPHSYNMTVSLIELSAEICKVMLQEYHKSLSEEK